MTSAPGAPVAASAVFADWAASFLAMTEGSRARRQRALQVAVTVWNAVVLEDAGVTPGAVAEVRSALGRLPAEEAAIVLAVVDSLVDRKRTAFAEARWTVSRCELRAGGRLFIEARAVPPPAH